MHLLLYSAAPSSHQPRLFFLDWHCSRSDLMVPEEECWEINACRTNAVAGWFIEACLTFCFWLIAERKFTLIGLVYQKNPALFLQLRGRGAGCCILRPRKAAKQAQVVPAADGEILSASSDHFHTNWKKETPRLAPRTAQPPLPELPRFFSNTKGCQHSMSQPRMTLKNGWGN